MDNRLLPRARFALWRTVPLQCIIVCLGSFGVPVAPVCGQAPPIPGNWSLEFEDEFSGDHVDGSRWKIGEHWSGINGAAGNSPDHISVANGNLVIRAEQQPVVYSGSNYGYSAGEISTFKRFRQLYGYFEARVKYDAVRGVWPAFWAMPNRGNYGNVSENYVSFLKFDLTGVPHASVDSALLTLHVLDGDTNGVQNVVALHVTDDTWSEGTVTWNDQPAHDAIMIAQAYNPDLGAGDTLMLDITDAVNRELAGDRIVSVMLVDGFMRVVGVSFNSRESANNADRPTLEVSSNGLPTTLVALEDAAARGGSHADTNFGSETFFRVREDWRDTSTTFSGGMEMDILESLGIWGDDWTQHALHWDGYGGSHQSTSSGKFSFPSTSDGYHTYGMYWAPGLLRFYVDGAQTFEWEDPRVCTTTQYLILSLQMGGWDGNWPADDASLPASMWVDYVRAWSGTACSQVAGDINGDDQTDLVDLAMFVSEITGPGGTIAPGGACADLDGDGDVDLADSAIIERNMGAQ